MAETLKRFSIKTFLKLSYKKLFFFIVIFFTCYTQITHTYILVYSGCSQEKYQPNSAYDTNLKSLFSAVETSSSQTLYSNFAIGNDSSAEVFGLYQCRGDLQTKDCSTCISTLLREIVLLCPYTDGATLQLDGCMIRYEHVDFLGKLDTSVVHERCSKHSINDPEFLHRREDVLGDLGASSGFRVSSAGSVEGYAQCLGDLNGLDCSSCLSYAIGKAKSFCGSAAAGDMFLSQCYVRYWESGYYEKSSDPSNDDDAGKTVAIIIGVIVGVVILIVLLSICRKAY